MQCIPISLNITAQDVTEHENPKARLVIHCGYCVLRLLYRFSRAVR